MSTFFIAVPLSVFLIFVAPLWVYLHYRSKKTTDTGISQDDAERLQQLAKRAENMNARIVTLEKILDSESPNWRRDYDR